MRPSRLGSLVVAAKRAVLGLGIRRTGGAILRRLRPGKAARGWGDPQSGDPGPHPFDTALGVETGGFIDWRELQSGGANDPYISGYLGVMPSICRRMIDVVDDPSRYVFVDYGCGKGRAAIIASERPFRRIVGLEIAPALAETARRNASVIAYDFPQRPPIEIVQGDAVEYALPLEPLVLFFFQPFERPVMRAVLTRLERSLEAAPRPVILLYLNPMVRKLFDQSKFLHRLGEWSGRPADDELPFSLGGRGDRETFVAWGTRDTRRPGR